MENIRGLVWYIASIMLIFFSISFSAPEMYSRALNRKTCPKSLFSPTSKYCRSIRWVGLLPLFSSGGIILPRTCLEVHFLLTVNGYMLVFLSLSAIMSWKLLMIEMLLRILNRPNWPGNGGRTRTASCLLRHFQNWRQLTWLWSSNDFMVRASMSQALGVPITSRPLHLFSWPSQLRCSFCPTPIFLESCFITVNIMLV